MPIKRYDFTFPDRTDDATIELYALRKKPREEKFGHLRSAIDFLWNSYKPDCYMWNTWTEQMQQGFVENPWVTVTGSAASWKTTSLALYCLAKWFSSPTDTVVILTSVTLDGLRRRIWKEVTRYYNLRPAIGNLVQSRNCIQFTKGSDDAGIFGIATDKGEIDKAVGKIIGFHAPNIIVGVDEMQYVSEAIVEACVNLQAGCENFEFKGLGNADDPLDPHGRMCEPKNGWDSISPEFDEWETKRGICIHLDGRKSPNVTAGKIIYPGLINQKDIDSTVEMYGEDSPQLWQMRYGFWAPEGAQHTVLSSPMIAKFGAKTKALWQGMPPVLGAALDPAFEGGDRCILRIGKCGLCDVQNPNANPFVTKIERETKSVVSFEEIIPIKMKVDPNDPIHYQIARQVREACEQRGVSPFMFALDSTGEGGGLASIIQREWSSQILCVEFGGRASLRPVSSTNPKRSDLEYYNRVTELWYQFRLMVMNGQIRSLDDDTALEFCRRHYDKKGALICVEPKSKMKERTRQSPDLADAAVILVELFRQRTSHLKQAKAPFEPSSQWNKFVKRMAVEPEYIEA